MPFERTSSRTHGPTAPNEQKLQTAAINHIQSIQTLELSEIRYLYIYLPWDIAIATHGPCPLGRSFQLDRARRFPPPELSHGFPVGRDSNAAPE